MSSRAASSSDDKRGISPSPGSRPEYDDPRRTVSGVPPTTSPTRRTLPPSYLPAQLTSFVGREQELLAVTRLLLSPQVRLVTLVGPGGIGKTRLAIEIGFNTLERFRDGVFFIPLAPLRESEAAVLAIARTVGLRDAGDHPLDALKEWLCDREMLLVLDNSEQVVAVVLVVSELLTACPGLKLLVTSRTALNVRGEHLFEVPALGLPLKKHEIVLEEIERCDAVKLFVERATTIRSSFVLTAENVADIAEICRRLDGIPLAIELAAARIRLFTPQSMLARLTSRLELLGGGIEDLPERQRTMRNAIAWSYELLEPAEQRLFQRLSIFPGGCTLEAAEEVCGGDLDMDVVDGIDSLTRKSLVRAEEKAGEMRFSMLETIREYGLEMLKSSQEQAEISRRSVGFLLRLAEKAETELTGPNQARWTSTLEAEHDNLRFAMRWSLGTGGATEAILIASAIYRFWADRGHLSEGRSWLDSALNATLPSDSPSRAKALRGAGVLAWRQADLKAAQAFQGESLAISRRLGDLRGVGAGLNNLGGIALYQGDYAAAKKMGEEALEIYRTLGDKTNVAVLLTNLGGIAEQQGDFELAKARSQESLSISKETHDRSRMALALMNLAIVAVRQGEYSVARARCEEALELCREAGNRFMIASTLGQLAEVAIYQEDLSLAASCLRESMEIAREMSSKRVIAQLLDRFAALCAGGSATCAARLLGAADALREAVRITRAPVEQALYRSAASRAERVLGKNQFGTMWADGRNLSLDLAIDEALRASMPAPHGPGPQPPQQGPTHPLTPREIEVVRLVASGLSNAEIAEQLVISPRTAETHVNHVLNRLGFNSRIQVATWAIQKGLLPQQD